MATLTRGQKAAQTRLRNAESSGQRHSAISSPQADSSVNFDKVFLTLADGIQKLEKAVLHSIGAREESSLGLGAQDIQAKKQVGAGKSDVQPPVSVLVDDVHCRSSQLRFKAESLRDAIVHGVNATDSCQVMAQSASAPSQGPTKDGLNFAFSNMCAVEDCLDEIDRYLLNR